MDKLLKFQKLGLSETTLIALRKKGFEEPTPIQERTIPLLLQEDLDIVGQAQTGTGKTAAFGLPIVEKINERSKYIQALILTPTRELAIQVAEEISSFRGKKNIQISPIYGGQSIEQQLIKLKKGIDVVVGTPGRVLDHIKRKTIRLDKISFMVLDEADEMLNMGFIDDVEEILKATSQDKKTLLFSATMPREILNISKKYMKQHIVISVKKEQLTANLTDQIYFEVSHSDKFEALCRIIDFEKEFYGLIFCRTKNDVDLVAHRLTDRGYSSDALHGDISQSQREKILLKFKRKKTTILVATDVAARGIDIDNLTHVINYSLPQDPESYVHRIGRTGRAGKEGTAITFVTPEEYRKLLYIKRVAKTDIRKETLPKVSDIINRKKEQLKTDISSILEQSNYTKYLTLAQELLDLDKPETVIAALLKHSLQDELDEKNYTKIREVSVDRKGKSRLFVARGREDDMTPKKLIAFIKKEAKIDEVNVHDIKIFEKFSFITASFEDAEIILNSYKKKNRGKRPLIERAKEKKPARLTRR